MSGYIGIWVSGCLGVSGYRWFIGVLAYSHRVCLCQMLLFLQCMMCVHTAVAGAAGFLFLGEVDWPRVAHSGILRDRGELGAEDRELNRVREAVVDANNDD